MSVDCVLRRARSRYPVSVMVALTAAASLSLFGCSDQSLDPDEAHTAYLSMGAMVPEGMSSQAALVDAWQVQVSRPGEGILAQDAGAIGPEQVTVTVELSVTLEAPCEVLTIRIELLSNGEPWFRREMQTEICVGSNNGIQAQQLQWVGPILALSPSSLAFTLEEGQPPVSQTLTVTNSGGGTLDWSAAEDRWWLDLSPTSGSLGEGESEVISVTVSDFDLAGGQYQGVITVTDPDALGSPGLAVVILDYVQKPRIGLSTSALTFTTNELLDSDLQTVTITNVGGGTLSWVAAAQAGWVDIAPGSGSLGPGESSQLAVWVSAGENPPGTYQSELSFSDPNASNSPQLLAVQMTVLPRPRIGLSSGDLSFTTIRGQNPASQALTIRNDGGQTLNWNADLNGLGWLDLSSLSGALGPGQSQNLLASVNVAGLDPGEYQGTIDFTDPFALNSPQTVSVALSVGEGPLIGLSATALSVSMYTEENPGPRQITISNAGGGVLEWQGAANVEWILLTPTSGTLGTVGGVGLAQTVTVGIDADHLPAGSYTGDITFFDPEAANSPRKVTVHLTIEDRVPPVIWGLDVNLVQWSDPTCPNLDGYGHRWRATFNYSDSNGDVPIWLGQFLGTPVEQVLQVGDAPETTYTTASVDGDRFSGSARFDICIPPFWYYAFLWVRLQDSGGLWSKQIGPYYWTW